MNQQTFTVTRDLVAASQAAGVELAQLVQYLQDDFNVDKVTATWTVALLINKIISVANSDQDYRQSLATVIKTVSNYLMPDEEINN